VSGFKEGVEIGFGEYHAKVGGWFRATLRDVPHGV
jgi:hypothetical protein